MSLMDWKTYRSSLLGRIGELGKLSPDSVGGYLMATGAGAKTGHLNEKTRQLISLAVAVTTRCDGCISVHSQKAVENGATKEEIAEALGVAIAMNAGAALVYSVNGTLNLTRVCSDRQLEPDPLALLRQCSREREH